MYARYSRRQVERWVKETEKHCLQRFRDCVKDGKVMMKKNNSRVLMKQGALAAYADMPFCW
jgi:hypothetical protein